MCAFAWSGERAPSDCEVVAVVVLEEEELGFGSVVVEVEAAEMPERLEGVGEGRGEELKELRFGGRRSGGRRGWTPCS